MAARLEDLADLLLFLRINKRDSAILFAVTEDDQFRSGVPAEVVRVRSKIERLAKLIGRAVVDIDLPILRIGDDQLVKIRYVEDALRLRKSRDAVSGSAPRLETPSLWTALPANVSITSAELLPSAETNRSRRFGSEDM